MIRRILLGFLALITLTLGALLFLHSRRTKYLDEVLAQHGLVAPFAAFVVDTVKMSNIKQFEVMEASAQFDDISIQATVIPRAKTSFEQFSAQRLFQIENQYNRGASPYPGSLSRDTECPADFLPKKEAVSGPGWNGTLLRTFATSRKLFGVCNPAERHFAVAELILLCTQSGTVYDLTVFAPSGEKQVLDDLLSVKCGD